jgi:Ca-activated chloride channel family protein
VRQTLTNRTRRDAEYELLFPLPADASVSSFELNVNGVALPGELLGAAEARSIYQRIVRERRDPGLLEWAGRGLLRARVFPVPAAGRVELSFRYGEALSTVGDFRVYEFPLRGRFRGASAPQRWSLRCVIEAQHGVGALHSPTHEVAVHRENAARASASAEADAGLLERDFALYAAEQRAELGLALLAHRPPGADGTFALFFTPGTESTAARPKDMVFVLDVSGSMAGEKIAQARTALDACITALRPIDRFAIIAFHGEVAYSSVGLRPAIEAEKVSARQRISALAARGGTNLWAGLEAGLALAATEGEERSFHLLLLSDGLPTIGVTDPREILARADLPRRSDVRCFVFGVGDDVDTFLLDRLAEESRGSRQYVRPGQDLALAVRLLSERIAEPVLANVELLVVGAEVQDLVPSRMPDLFRGTTLAVLGRTRGSGPIVVRLRGRGERGPRSFAWAFDLPACDERCPELVDQWASRRIGVLLDALRWNGPQQELREEIERLGQEHGLVTPFTSLLALEERDRLALSRGVRLRPRVPMVSEADEFTLGTMERSGSRAATPGTPAGPATPAGPMSRSGPAAVDLSVRANALRAGAVGARLGEGAADAELRVVGGRRFFLLGGVWVEEGFREADRARVRRVEFATAAYFELVGRDELTARIAALGTRVLFRNGDGFVEIVDAGG